MLGVLLHCFPRRARLETERTRSGSLRGASCALWYGLFFARLAPRRWHRRWPRPTRGRTPTCLFPSSMSPKVVTYKSCDALTLISGKKSWFLVTLCSNLEEFNPKADVAIIRQLGRAIDANMSHAVLPKKKRTISTTLCKLCHPALPFPHPWLQ